MEPDASKKTSMVGSREVTVTALDDVDKETVYQTNSAFWDTIGNDVLGATALPFYGAFISEEKHRLFAGAAGKRLLEIGCGSGESLKYHGERGAGELWGMDIAKKQLERANRLLSQHGLSAKFICAPMEEECGIPENYFDYVYSVYAIGWATDLEKTFRRIASYLKKDGIFIFSWSHPIHKCVAPEDGVLVFKKCYFDESRYSLAMGDGLLTLSDYTMSAYVNALFKAGFVIEQMIEKPDEEIIGGASGDFARKAGMLPVTFVIKARKL